MIATRAKNLVALNAEKRSPLTEAFASQLKARVVGQDDAARALASLYEVFQAGLACPNRPIGSLLFLGPTGSGKTRAVEAAAEILFANPKAVIRIDCAEYQHSHEIAKLIGSPPGYLGHRETSPLLTQQSLNACHTDRNPFTFVLFDEIEKASDALWKLMLGILDKAALTLGDNQRVDFSQTIIVMTSNLGARQMSELVNGSLGFAPASASSLQTERAGQKLNTVALEAARRHFSPEFMNRLDKVVVFKSLQQPELARILDLELRAVELRLLEAMIVPFMFRLTDDARNFLLVEGTDGRYGARHLKRCIERFLVHPFANLVASQQVLPGDVIVVDCDMERREMIFYRDESLASRAQAAIEQAQAA